ncbi:Membrane proteins related to metalloendopeptidases [hydrothermal vent metagenome]|uniref:Membrane proteins related to metalloendopeptidases n=1 Tax=hydrothermal vent metagenome TaxID=652676 RepID=A0A3B1E555_9ZZZZ
MKDRIIVTISDIYGTKSYNLNKVIKQVVFYIVVIVVLLMGISFWIISSLNNKVSILSEEGQKLEIQNKMYSLQIDDKVKDIAALGKTLDEIEDIIGINQEENISLIQRATLAKLTSAQKTFMLQTIPSGSPLKELSISAKFGYRIHPISKTKTFHNGIDLRAKRKTNVYATADGIVKYTRVQIHGGFGTIMKITHNYGFETTYAHLNQILVSVGDVVHKGDLIALSGNTGYSTGPHLHYEIHYSNKIVNPVDYIKWNMQDYNAIFTKQRRIKWESLVDLIRTQVQHLVAQQ